jgi:addiction module RelE/StbE family toxin
MTVRFHTQFEKQFQKLRKNQKAKVKERAAIFLDDPFAPILNNHPLQGACHGYRSINIGGDLQAVYRLLAPDTAVFVAVGKHTALYE